MSLIQTVTGPREGETFTAKSFLNYMRKSSDHWWKDAESNTHCPWIFRGHWDADWKLKPTAGRDSLENNETFQKLVENIKVEAAASSDWQSFSDVSKEILSRQWAQYTSLKAFLDLADELSFGISMRDDFIFNYLSQYSFVDLLSTQRLRFGSIMHGHSIRHNGFNRIALALAQHHGVPTFLLDWTKNPLTACYFATTKPNNIETKNGLAIWALNTLSLPLCTSDLGHDTCCTISITDTFKSQNEFLSKQSGVFLEISGYEGVWRQRGAYPALEDIVSDFERENAIEAIELLIEKSSKSGPIRPGLKESYLERFPDNLTILKKVVLTAEHQGELQDLLLKEGITKAHLMPNLDNIASTAMTSLIRG